MKSGTQMREGDPGTPDPPALIDLMCPSQSIYHGVPKYPPPVGSAAGVG